MGFPRQEHWSGWPIPSPRDLPDSGIKPVCPVSPALADLFFTSQPSPQIPGSPWLDLHCLKARFSVGKENLPLPLNLTLKTWTHNEETGR